MTKVDSRLDSIYNEAMSILKDYEKDLLRYSEYSSLTSAMRNIDSVSINRRSKSRRGCCKFKGTCGASVEISEYMLDLPEKEVLTTMIHELLHTFKDSRGHTGNWLRRANFIKNVTGYNVTRVRTIEGEYEIRKNYYEELDKKREAHTIIHKCNNCGCEIVRHRETNFTKHPERYRCSQCGGKFQRV